MWEAAAGSGACITPSSARAVPGSQAGCTCVSSADCISSRLWVFQLSTWWRRDRACGTLDSKAHVYWYPRVFFLSYFLSFFFLSFWRPLSLLPSLKKQEAEALSPFGDGCYSRSKLNWHTAYEFCACVHARLSTSFRTLRARRARLWHLWRRQRERNRQP